MPTRVFSHELFLEDHSRIHITSFEQLQEVKKFYENEYGLDVEEHSVGAHNWDRYPYLFSEDGGIHGCKYMKEEHPTIEFEQWAEYAGLLVKEIEESEQDLNFLFT